jgi:hypothetical protein
MHHGHQEPNFFARIDLKQAESIEYRLYILPESIEYRQYILPKLIESKLNRSNTGYILPESIE